ncbi:hypothetical protein X971_0997 [Agrobacterium tumefaciens LBA4213 (Ach5)]|nr:hypothetical protein X971_0997 [Agrobacterium tumefaciens LBA4213 (Ach5)]
MHFLKGNIGFRQAVWPMSRRTTDNCADFLHALARKTR